MTFEIQTPICFNENAIKDCRNVNVLGASHITPDGWVNMPKLKRDISMKGVFYKDVEGSNGTDRFYCVVGNLVMYKGYLGKDGSLHIDSVMPYKQSMRNMLVKSPILGIPSITKHRADLDSMVRQMAA